MSLELVGLVVYQLHTCECLLVGKEVLHCNG